MRLLLCLRVVPVRLNLVRVQSSTALALLEQSIVLAGVFHLLR
jgi:hypothetical protein